MTNEIKHLLRIAAKWQLSGKSTVLATVVYLEGSSYRRPGVQMIVNDRGEASGAVSGGCIEKEILFQARSVFDTGKAKMMNYDGRLRLGCDGLIFLLLEPLVISSEMLESFNMVLKNRKSFVIENYFYRSVGEFHGIGSMMKMDHKQFTLNPSFNPDEITDQECFSQTFPPIFQLHIFGAEHDAVQLCRAASLLGWEITIVAWPEEAKSVDYFPGATRLIAPAFSDLDTSLYDEQTAIILMSHSFNKDVQYLMALKDVRPAYFGMLGPKQRRERVLSEFLDYCPDASPEFLELLHGPAGINIGADSASEISISILAEILSTVRNQKPMALMEKTGSIHG